MLGEGDVAYGTPGGSRAYPESTEENAGSVLAWQGGEAYEDMCRKYVERYLKGVENFVHQSGLEARVGEWQEKLAPKLEAEEKREVFDIHLYGDRVKTLVSKQSTNKEVPFGKAVAGLQQFDVCRAFLAALQLANDGNVEISLKGEADNQP
jgi:condensin-2 complex subunit H2